MRRKSRVYDNEPAVRGRRCSVPRSFLPFPFDEMQGMLSVRRREIPSTSSQDHFFGRIHPDSDAARRPEVALQARIYRFDDDLGLLPCETARPLESPWAIPKPV